METRSLLRQIDLEIPVILAFGGGFGAAAGCGFISFYWLLFPAICGIFLSRRCRIALVIAIAAAISSGLLWHGRQKAVAREYDRSGNTGGVIVIRDNRATRHKDIALTSRVRATFQRHGSVNAVPVLLRFPEWEQGVPLLYGDRFEVNGILTVPDKAGFYYGPNGMTGEIPSPYGTGFLFSVAESRKIEAENSITRGCFYLREVMLSRLLSQIKARDVRKMAARLLLGASDGAEVEVKRGFVLSGIIHLFAVSGMHVGILALIVGILLRPLPVQVRYSLLTVVTLCYVGVSGMAISALRAGAMIGVWAVLKACLYRTEAKNILSLAYFSLCIGEPAAVGELGTLYSYGITAVLISGLTTLHEHLNFARWKLFLMPENAALTVRYFRRVRRRNRLVSVAAAAVLAFITSAMLTMRSNKLFLPGSILTNLLTTVITPLTFVVFLFKMALGWMSELLDALCAWMLTGCFRMLQWCAGVSLEIFDVIPVIEPPGYWCALFYILLFAVMMVKNFRLKIGILSVCIIMLITPSYLVSFRKSEVIVISGSSGHPPLLAYLPAGESRAQVCNIPDSWSGVIAAGELLRRGCNEADVSFSGRYSRYNSGIKAFSSRIKVTAVHLSDGKISGFFKKNLRSGNGGTLPLYISHETPEKKDIPENTVVWHPDEEVEIFTESGDDGCHVTVRKGSAFQEQITIPWSRSLLLWRSVIK